MDEAARKARNAERIGECFGPYGAVVRKVLNDLEAQGFRPRIQDAWRSPEDQLKAFASGHSKLKFGFHNVTGAGGSKQSLACDILDDDNPLKPRTRHLLALAIAARKHGVHTGISWGLPASLASGVEAAIATGNLAAPVKVGWDPTHTEPVGITASQAKAGVRPTFAAGAGPPAAGGGGGHTHIVTSGDTLSKIAKVAGITLARLLQLNPELAAHPNVIHPGDVVRLD